MSPPLTDRQRALLQGLDRLAREIAELAPALAERRRSETARADAELAAGREALARRLAAARDAGEVELRRATAAAEARAAEEVAAAEAEFEAAHEALTARFDAEAEAADAAVQEATWAAETVLEGARSTAANRLRGKNARLAGRVEELQAIARQAREQLARWKQPADDLDAAAKKRGVPSGTSAKVLRHLDDARAHLHALTGLSLPRLLRGRRLVGLGLLLCLLLAPAGWLVAQAMGEEVGVGLRAGLGAVATVGAAGVVGLALHAVLEAVARRHIARVYLPLRLSLIAGEKAAKRARRRYQQEHDEALRAGQERYGRNLGKAQRRQRRRDEVERRRAAALAGAEQRMQARRRAAEARRGDELAAAKARHGQSEARLAWEDESGRAELEARHRAEVGRVASETAAEWQALTGRWAREREALLGQAGRIKAECAAMFPAWEVMGRTGWRPPAAAPGVVRFGEILTRFADVPTGPPWTMGPASPAEERTQPALRPFPESSSFLLHAHDAGRPAALTAVQAILYRLLTGLPPGRVRLTLLDPVGLGRNFAPFMNLADFDESLVGGRAWTEAAHIEARLADLTAHMENVIQKYLRNRFASITDYNDHAGEVAEPFRILVIADFPANFTAEAARRLVSIAQSGPRCGVCVLITRDTKHPLPQGLDLADLERACTNLDWHDGRFAWRDDEYAALPLTLDQPPDDELANRLLQQVGEAARGARRVEVPFDFVVPPREQWWTGDARPGLRVALGRAGAVRRQFLELGKGTAQHGLVVGKTGSGKSTLLHVLVTNLALAYSPDEVELYLIDFKKGVEFKTYATHELPHARVIAIESEREFGLSVLRRLDAELTARGDRFRAAGAQDLAAYRQAEPGAYAPRVLLVVDEFQELFVEDDRLAQEAAQLLDRLVRQGRAFGLHVLLGSQTLAGAYSLARSTIDQMAVRIALQCSEADAHLVLSEDNGAARLLSRSGEAIYNDANGLVEGNDPFQVVWLDETVRERYLGEVRSLAERRPSRRRLPAVVFEGSAAADIGRNEPLARLLAGAPGDPAVQRAWLGEAMAIDELTCAAFKRQNGSNLLLVGQQPEAALGMLVTATVSLAAQGARVYFIDGHQADAPTAGPLAALGAAVKLAGWRGLGAVMEELSAELKRRQDAAEEPRSIYLVLHGLQRFRDLRRAEDDFGPFGGGGQADTPARQFVALLREGPTLGVHVLVWCDTLNNLGRALDRTALRELALRVAGQMNIGDSSSLIDTPAASKLGPHRALFASEEDGRVEKFRPYGVPSEAWLREALKR